MENGASFLDCSHCYLHLWHCEIEVPAFWGFTLINRWPSLVRLQIFLFSAVLENCTITSGKSIMVPATFYASVRLLSHRIPLPLDCALFLGLRPFGEGRRVLSSALCLPVAGFIHSYCQWAFRWMLQDPLIWLRNLYLLLVTKLSGYHPQFLFRNNNGRYILRHDRDKLGLVDWTETMGVAYSSYSISQVRWPIILYCNTVGGNRASWDLWRFSAVSCFSVPWRVSFCCWPLFRTSWFWLLISS